LSGKVIGVFVLYADKVDAFDMPARNLLSEMAMDIGFALDNFARDATRQFAEQELRIAATAFEAQEAILVTDARKTILRVNQSFTKMTGYDSDEIIGKSPAVMHSGKHGKSFYSEMRERLSKDHYWHGEIWNRHKSGAIFPAWVTITAVTDDKGEISNYVSFYSDLSQHKKDEDSINTLAFYDQLTRLPNRRLFIERLQHVFAVSRHHSHHVAVMFIDIDNFKTLNDTMGHNMGDMLLMEVTKRLQNCAHEGDSFVDIAAS
jgi:PAS domain S-box-containing protein